MYIYNCFYSSTESGLSESDSGLTNGSNDDAGERERALREKVNYFYISIYRYLYRTKQLFTYKSELLFYFNKVIKAKKEAKVRR